MTWLDDEEKRLQLKKNEELKQKLAYEKLMDNLEKCFKVYVRMRNVGVYILQSKDKTQYSSNVKRTNWFSSNDIFKCIDNIFLVQISDSENYLIKCQARHYREYLGPYDEKTIIDSTYVEKGIKTLLQTSVRQSNFKDLDDNDWIAILSWVVGKGELKSIISIFNSLSNSSA